MDWANVAALVGVASAFIATVASMLHSWRSRADTKRAMEERAKEIEEDWRGDWYAQVDALGDPTLTPLERQEKLRRVLDGLRTAKGEPVRPASPSPSGPATTIPPSAATDAVEELKEALAAAFEAGVRAALNQPRPFPWLQLVSTILTAFLLIGVSAWLFFIHDNSELQAPAITVFVAGVLVLGKDLPALAPRR